MLVELASAAGSVVREYPFLLEESRPRGQRAAAWPALPEAGPAAAAREPGCGARAGTAAPARIEGEGYVVKPGDTLAGIAQAQGLAGATIEQAIVAIYQANEPAFFDANLNRLRSGQRLAIPTPDAALAIDPAEARRIVLAHGASYEITGGSSPAPRPLPAPAQKRRPLPRAESGARPAQRLAGGAPEAGHERRRDRARGRSRFGPARARRGAGTVGLLEKSLDDVRMLLAMKDHQFARMARQAQGATFAGDAAAADQVVGEPDSGDVLSRFLSHYGGWLILGFAVGFVSWISMPLKTVRLWWKKRRRRQRDLHKHARRVRRAARKAGLLSTSA